MGHILQAFADFPELSQQWDKPTLIPWSIWGRRMWSASEQPQHKVHIMPPERTTLHQELLYHRLNRRNHIREQISNQIFLQGKTAAPFSISMQLLNTHPHIHTQTKPQMLGDSSKLQWKMKTYLSQSLCVKNLRFQKRKHSRDLSS